ncbi:ABC transporter ATP-binding protein [Paenibacillus sp. strain BS8-2]
MESIEVERPASGRTTIKRLLSYALRYKYRIVIAIFILCCAVGAELAGPLIVKAIIDDHLSQGGVEQMAPVLRLLLLYVGLLVAASCFHFLQSYMLQSTALRIIKNMRMDLMGQIHRIPLRYFDNTPIGGIVSRVANDTEAVRELFMSFMATFVVSFVQLAGIYIALFVLDVKLALLCLLLLPLFALIMVVHLRYSKRYIAIMRARLSDMNAMINESINVMPIIQAFRRERRTIDEFEKLNNDRYVNQVKQFRVFSLSSRNIVGTIGALLTAFVLWYFGGQALEGAILFGVLYAFIDYLGRIFHPIIGIFDQLTNAQRAYVSAEKIFSIMDMDGVDVDTAPNDKRPKGDIVFRDVTFSYKSGEPVLKGITFEVKRGETLALVGHTGSGKSSIMNLLLGFYEPDQGEITIDGRNIATMSKQELRSPMGIVLQDPFLFAGDVAFNVSLHQQDITPERVWAALKEVGAESFVQSLPQGLSEPVVERGSTFSAGQRQLISFARALAYDPAILILDEATASVDSETEHIIQRALKVVSEGRTTLVIAHRLSTIRDADHILVLHRGEIVERGNHDALMALGGRYHRMYRLQMGEESASPATSNR